MNIDNQTVEKFSSLANEWWDKNGPLHTLHSLNPIRLEYIENFISIENKKILDVGCGAGILSESMQKKGANVDALDASKMAIDVAKKHAKDNSLDIKYHNMLIEDYNSDEKYNVITCMEMLEHVPNPESVIMNISRLVKKDGLVFISTLNRSIISYLTSIIAAEHILRVVPKGTHKYKDFIKPYEILKQAEENSLEMIDIKGISYNPLFKSFKIIKNTNINYILCLRKI